MKLAIRDRELMWHPFTQEKTAPLPIAILSAKGAYVYTDDGKSLLDLISSWWVNLHGHGHPSIAQAIYRQAKQLDHVLFAGCTHEPAVSLCESLRLLLPQQLRRFFFSDNGSTAVEVAIKMAFQYWHNRHESRHLFLCFEGGYHGDTVGAMSVGRESRFHDVFQPLMFETKSLPFPATWHDDELYSQKEQSCLEALKKMLLLHKGKIAAFLLEPLVQGAGGMRMCRPQFLQAAIDLVREQGIVIIFDEVMTGFGRTGTLFALEQVARAPDILCLAKGLTGGILPLAITVATEEIYQEFLGTHFDKALAHGHSYTAHPLGCAAALASLNLLKQQKTRNSISLIQTTFKKWISPFRNCPKVFHLRQLGTIFAFEVKDPESSYRSSAARQFQQKFIESNLLLRPLGNTLYLLPPYCVTVQQLNGAMEKILRIVS